MKRWFFALWACALTAGAAATEPQSLQAGIGERLMTLTAAGSQARLELPGGVTRTLPLAASAELSSLAAVDGGWALAGSFVAEDGRRRLFLVAGDESQARELPAPDGQQGAVRSGAVLLVDAGRLAGLAWLEGDGPQALAVRVSRRHQGGWEPPRALSSPGPGSQLALTGTVLSDGSWLLAWSAFDGTDDEIVWTRRVGEVWLPVRRLTADNRVPDITPAVVAAGGGALAAWSRYDGDHYRLAVARLEGERWQEQPVAAGAGALYPRFVAGDGTLHLLHLSARPAGWRVLELSDRGKARRSAFVATRRLATPLLAEVGGGAVRLRWPGRKAGLSARWREEGR